MPVKKSLAFGSVYFIHGLRAAKSILDTDEPMNGLVAGSLRRRAGASAPLAFAACAATRGRAGLLAK